MSPPNRVLGSNGVIYDHDNGVCELPPEPICSISSNTGPSQENPDQYIRLSSANLVQLAASGTQVRTNHLWTQSPLAVSVLSIPFSLTGCSEDNGVQGLTGRPIAGVDPSGEEVTLNTDPILGKVRQVDISMPGNGQSTTAWSVSDFMDPNQHGTFAVTGSAGSLNSQVLVASSDTSIPRDTSVAVLSNGDSVVVFSRVQGDDAPSSIVAQRIDSSGNPVGSEIAVLPDTIRTTLPEGQVVATADGFVVVYRDGEGNLGLAEFDLNGTETSRQTIGPEPIRFKITQGSDNEWALAEITGPEEVRVRTFSGSASGGVDTHISTSAIPNSPNISVAMQEDGSMMVAWNGLLNGDDPILEGTFLDANGSQVGGRQILRNLVIGSGFDSADHINSHSLTTDHQGNFILAFEENRNVVAYFYNGDQRDDHSLTEISSRVLESSGPYADILGSLDNQNIQNVDVRVEADQNGQLSFVYTKILSGTDPDTGETITVQRITRRDYQIQYE